MSLRIAFLGTSDFAVPSLRQAVRHGDVAVVVTQPAKPGHRGKPAPRPIADLADELGLPILTPARIRDPAAAAEVLGQRVDVLIVASYGQILPIELLEGPRLGAVNVHASLLPRWRGASPVAAAIRAGDERTGVSIMRVEAGLDTGPVYATREIPLQPDATTPAVTAHLAELGAELLVTVLGQLEAGTAVAVAQDEARATPAPRLTRADGVVDWAQHSAADVDRMVRAYHPWPGVSATVEGQTVKVGSGVAIGTTGGAPGDVVVVDPESITIRATEDAYRIDMLQPPGKPWMTAGAYARGRHLAPRSAESA